VSQGFPKRGVADAEVTRGDTKPLLVAFGQRASSVDQPRIDVSTFVHIEKGRSRSLLVRMAVAFLWSATAPVKSYGMALWLAQLDMPSAIWQQVFALAGGVIASTAALGRVADRPKANSRWRTAGASALNIAVGDDLHGHMDRVKYASLCTSWLQHHGKSSVKIEFSAAGGTFGPTFIDCSARGLHHQRIGQLYRQLHPPTEPSVSNNTIAPMNALVIRATIPRPRWMFSCGSRRQEICSIHLTSPQDLRLS
jgi:hypothetical protein